MNCYQFPYLFFLLRCGSGGSKEGGSVVFLSFITGIINISLY